MSYKMCTKCKQSKSVSQFSMQRGKPRSICKRCHNDYVREVWYKKNAEKQRAAAAKWREANPTKILASKYGVSVEYIEELLSRGKCDICSSTEKLCIDHCHQTNVVRGVLCHFCNTALGLFRDDVALLRAAGEYLGKIDTQPSG